MPPSKKTVRLSEKPLLRIAVVLSLFNRDIASALKTGAEKELKRTGLGYLFYEVPGVVEIPLASKWLFQKGYPVVVALGSVIRGETSHYSACCRLVEQGIMQVQLEMNRPLIFGILMTENRQQALSRAGGDKGDMGGEAIRTALKMHSLQEAIKKSTPLQDGLPPH